MASSSVSPWEVPEFKDRVQELQHRLAFADIAAEIPDCSWDYGVPRDVMLQWVKFWKVEVGRARFCVCGGLSSDGLLRGSSTTGLPNAPKSMPFRIL